MAAVKKFSTVTGITQFASHSSEIVQIIILPSSYWRHQFHRNIFQCPAANPCVRNRSDYHSSLMIVAHRDVFDPSAVNTSAFPSTTGIISSSRQAASANLQLGANKQSPRQRVEARRRSGNRFRPPPARSVQGRCKQAAPSRPSTWPAVKVRSTPLTA